jgi:hypothetical protein
LVSNKYQTGVCPLLLSFIFHLTPNIKSGFRQKRVGRAAWGAIRERPRTGGHAGTDSLGGDEIPENLYRAVAEVIAFAYIIAGKFPPGFQPETREA